MIDRKTSHGFHPLMKGFEMLNLGGVAGCILHPYQRLDCGCSCEQRIRIIIILQVLQFDVG
jgi:hypothetical protein